MPDFSPQAQQEAESLPSAIPAAEAGVRDLCNQLWCSIDNDDSRDLDQLSVAEALDGGVVRVWVAIADVDSRVPLGSAIDEHARLNTTSVYTAGGIFPMLPERLSTDLTSLVEGEDRLAVVIEMDVDSAGTLVRADVFRARVRNQAKLAYPGVAAWLDEKAPAPDRLAAVKGMEAQLRMQDQVAQLLRRLRHERGALSLETSESRAVFTNGVLSDFHDEQKNRAQEMIEDLMIAANGVTARYLTEKSFPSLRRVLGAPARWDRLMTVAAEVGDKLPSAPDAVALDAFLARQRAAQPERFADLSLSVVKLLGAGRYAVEMPGQTSPGHFGLAVRDYTHSTAPNRRFPDLITQRLLKAALAGAAPPYAQQQLEALADHCTRQESNASKVERQVRKSATAVLLATRIGEQFDAIVTGVSEKGTWVRTRRPVAEGRVVQNFEGLDVGDRVSVKLLRTDIERGFIDFARSERAPRI